MSNEENLQAIVEKAIAEGHDFDAEVSGAIEEIEEAREQDTRRALTIKERLKRRLLSGYIEIPFKDDMGDFVIRLRLPSPAQRKILLQLTLETEKYIEEENEEELDRLDDEMCNLVGHLCLDFDAAYLKSGENFGVDVIQKLMRSIIGLEPVRMEEYKFFRSTL